MDTFWFTDVTGVTAQSLTLVVSAALLQAVMGTDPRVGLMVRFYMLFCARTLSSLIKLTSFVMSLDTLITATAAQVR